jgi:V8-like Glu-specific endopeptidase
LKDYAIIDRPNFLPISFLEKGYNIQKCIARIVLPQNGLATGFLISPSLLITNYHVLPSKDIARGAKFQFNYQNDINGEACQEISYTSDTEIFYTNPLIDYDYTILNLNENPGDKWGFSSLVNNSNPLLGDNCIIIQHPYGRRKEIALQESAITEFAAHGIVKYTCDTDEGSSGAPLYDNEWRLLALHHNTGDVERNSQTGKTYCKNNIGGLVTSIIKDLQSHNSDNNVQKILQELGTHSKLI